MTAPRCARLAQRAVIRALLDGLSPYDAEDMTRREIALALDECRAAGWITTARIGNDLCDVVTPAGREAAVGATIAACAELRGDK